MTLDLGCGDGKRGDVGIDLYDGPGVDRVLSLGFDGIPFPYSTIERVYAYDFLEHLPKMVYFETDIGATPHHPHIQLFNEVWRVLEPKGIFETFTPTDPELQHGRVFHVSEWNLETFRQFTAEGSDFKRGFMQQAGFNGEFKIVHHQQEARHIRVDLQAVKTK